MNLHDIKSPADLADNYDLEAYLRKCSEATHWPEAPFMLAAADEIRRLREAGFAMTAEMPNVGIELVQAALGAADAINHVHMKGSAAFARLVTAAEAIRTTQFARAGGIELSGSLRATRERYRQVGAEGYTAAHDDAHSHGQLAAAALCYVEAHLAQLTFMPSHVEAHVTEVMAQRWPWEEMWFKWENTHRLRNLEKACALLMAEMDRVQREIVAAGQPVPPSPERVSLAKKS